MTNSFTFKDFKEGEFDEHINSSIPTLNALDGLVDRMTYDMAQEDTCVIDLGCSTGRVLRSMQKHDNVSYWGIDRDMDNDHTKDITFFQKDITENGFTLPKSSVIISMFTLQFLPTYKRKAVIATIHESLVDDGIFIFAEKTHASNPRVDVITQTALMQHKTRHFTAEEIVNKQIGISPIMHIRTEPELFEELHKFSHKTTIWAWGGFRAIIATK